MLVDRATAQGLFQLLSKLYAEQGLHSAAAYMAEHGQPAVIKHQVNVFAWYAKYLPNSGTFLDWGCNHGPDSAMLRSVFGDRIDLHACDLSEEAAYPVFRDFARPKFQQLSDVVELPYPNDAFDAVLGSGVLEHVAMDYESLKELHRILKPGGLLLISYLPHALSWNEWYRRTIRKEGFHRRLYRKSEISQLLKRSGFYPEEIGFHTFLPHLLREGWKRQFEQVLGDGMLKRIRSALIRSFSPIYRHSTLHAAAWKMMGM